MKYSISIILFISLFSFSEAYSQGCNGSASFSYVNNGNAEVSFTNTSSVAGSITAYAWNFGDGSTSYQPNPTHTYGANRYYTVTLNITSVQDFGYYGTLTCNDSTSNNIMVNNSNSAYGCMDISACNYDPNATVDDGSCISSSNWVTLEMNDSYGDGWNGDTWSAISTSGGESYGPFTLNSGLSGSESFCMAEDSYDITCDFGTYAYETSWSLICNNGTILDSGGSPYNAMLNIAASSCSTDCLNDLDEDNICDENDDCVGEWVEDIETGNCSIYTSYGEDVCTSYTGCEWVYGWGGWVIGDTFDCMYTYEVDNGYCDALLIGCIDSEACNYDSEAEVDNGQCTFNEVGYDCDGIFLCPIDLDTDGYVGVTDLLIILSNFGCVSDCSGDLNGDGTVAIDDLLGMLSSFGNPC